ncbi:MAG: Fur family transcriptional regulator [Thermodesulfobacteriota bacterium]|jgi:Fur family ferric uptake transcriptional regulator
MTAAPFGKRQTRQRDTILKVLQESRGPLAVREIHGRAQQTLRKLGIATVYRTLKLLRESQQIEELTLPNGETRYELTGLEHHHHFQCRHCRQVFDLRICPLSIPRGTTFPGDFLVETHEVTLYGVCPDCVDRLERSKKGRGAGRGHRPQ